MDDKSQRMVWIDLEMTGLDIERESIIEIATVITDSPVSYTHLRAHETRHDLVCRLLLEKKNGESANRRYGGAL